MPEIAGWRLNDNDFLRLLDAQGNSVLEFSEVESGIFEAPKPGEGILFIQNPTDLGPAPKTAEQMKGDWNVIRRTGQRDLRADPVEHRGRRGVRRARAAAAAIRWWRGLRRRPGRWIAARSCCARPTASPGASRRREDAKWQRIPQTANPLLMVRK